MADQLLTTVAEQGSVIGMRLLGNLCSDENNPNRDEQRAYEWYLKSAQSGDVFAMSRLAWRLEKGIVSAPDFEQAYYWYQKAADHGDSYCMIHVGYYIAMGQVVPKDVKKGIELIQKGVSLEANAPEFGYYLLGRFCETGEGMPKDMEKALQYYEKALEKDSEEALYRMALLYDEGKVLPKNTEKAREYCMRVREDLQYSTTCVFDDELLSQIQILLEKLRNL